MNITIANNPDSTSHDLSLVANKSFKINRLIAAHPNASAEVLSTIIEYRNEIFENCDDETQRIAIKNPNISSTDILRLANKFPEDLFANPSIERLISELPHLFEDNYTLLQTSGCPLEVLKRIAEEGTRAEIASIARNPTLPLELKNKLTPSFFHQRDLSAIEQIALEQANDTIRDCLRMYANISRPFCIPTFLPFNRDSLEHRLSDQIFCGFPFTSVDFPWPVESLGHYMQPIAQINLVNASKLIGVNLGDGLLQVWGGIESSTKVELQTRVIPQFKLKQDADWFYPTQAPWLDDNYNFDGCVHSCIDQEDFIPFSLNYCRIDWNFVGQMFYPSIYSRVFDSRAEDRLDHGLYQRKFEFDAELEEVENTLSNACISRHSSLKESWGRKPLAILGGYPQALGNAWAGYPDQMLFYHSLDYATMDTVGVMYKFNHDGAVSFHVNWTSDN